MTVLTRIRDCWYIDDSEGVCSSKSFMIAPDDAGVAVNETAESLARFVKTPAALQLYSAAKINTQEERQLTASKTHQKVLASH